MPINIYHIYTDGSYSPSTGIGTYAFVILKNGNLIHKIVGYKNKSSSSEMEELAIELAIKFKEYHLKSSKAVIYTDYYYLVRKIKYPKRYSFKNKKLFYMCKCRERSLIFEWVKAHSNSYWNCYVDTLCRHKRLDLEASYFKELKLINGGLS